MVIIFLNKMFVFIFEVCSNFSLKNHTNIFGHMIIIFNHFTE
jgi:hypothetical protein